MNKLRFVGAILLAIIMIVPQGALAVEARAPEAGVVAAFVPNGGMWTGKTSISPGYLISFVVNSVGTSWSSLFIFTSVTISGCTAVHSSNVPGPVSISANSFSVTSGTLHLTGKFTSATSATGTFSWTNQPVAGCSGKTFSQSGTWTANAPAVAPGPFSKSSPSLGALNQSPASLLKWAAAANAKSYQYCFDTVNDNKCNTAWTPAGAVTSVDPPGVFQPGRTYYWQVRAVNGTALTYANSGAWWSFTVKPPAVLTLRSFGPQDGWIVESTSTSGLGLTANAVQTGFRVGDDKLNRQYRAILSFPTNNLPPNAVIMAVTLRVLKSGGTPTNPFLTLGGLVADIRKGTFGTNVLQASDFQSTANKNAVLALPNTAVGAWAAKALTGPNFVYINRLGLTQFRLRFARDSNNNGVADFVTYASGDSPTVGNRPQLIIQYYVP